MRIILLLAPLFSALLLFGAIMIVSDPDFDRHRNNAAVLLSEVVLVADVIIAAIGCFVLPHILDRLAKISMGVSAACMFLLAVTCGPNFQLPHVIISAEPAPKTN